MRPLRLAVLALSFAVTAAFASPADPKLGVEYTALANPVAAPANGKKVEVIEFFMLHCPHCYALEPEMEAWVKKQGDNIDFKRVHFSYTGPKDPEAHTYLTLEALGMQDQIYPIMQYIAKQRRYWNKDEDAMTWLAQSGIDKAKFMDAWNSFGVMSKLARIAAMVDKYKIDSAPNIVIDGRFVTSPAHLEAGTPGMNEAGANKVIGQTLDAVVAKVQKERGGKAGK